MRTNWKLATFSHWQHSTDLPDDDHQAGGPEEAERLGLAAFIRNPRRAGADGEARYVPGVASGVGIKRDGQHGNARFRRLQLLLSNRRRIDRICAGGLELRRDRLLRAISRLNRRAALKSQPGNRSTAGRKAARDSEFLIAAAYLAAVFEVLHGQRSIHGNSAIRADPDGAVITSRSILGESESARIDGDNAHAVDGRIAQPERTGTVECEGVGAEVERRRIIERPDKAELACGGRRRIALKGNAHGLAIVIVDITSFIDEIRTLFKNDVCIDVDYTIRIKHSAAFDTNSMACAATSLAQHLERSATNNVRSRGFVVERPGDDPIPRLYDSAVVDDVADTGNLFRSQFLAGRNAHRRT